MVSGKERGSEGEGGEGGSALEVSKEDRVKDGMEDLVQLGVDKVSSGSCGLGDRDTNEVGDATGECGIGDCV